MASIDKWLSQVPTDPKHRMTGKADQIIYLSIIHSIAVLYVNLITSSLPTTITATIMDNEYIHDTISFRFYPIEIWG